MASIQSISQKLYFVFNIIKHVPMQENKRKPGDPGAVYLQQAAGKSSYGQFQGFFSPTNNFIKLRQQSQLQRLN